MSDPSADRDPLERMADSFVGRLRAGEHPSMSEYASRYPELADELPELLPALVELERAQLLDASMPGRIEAQDGGVPVQRLGEYTLLREIGRGGMGVVYEAVQETLGRHVALKVLSSAGLRSSQLERFRREARAAARLHHTNIVPVFGIGEDSGTHFYAMQYIEGQSLDYVIEELKQLCTSSDDRIQALSRHAAQTGAVAAILTGRVGADNIADSHSDPPPVPNVQRHPDSLVNSFVSKDVATRFVPAELSPPKREYYRSLARVGLQVAEGLSYAHLQGVLHRDIKPSNLMLDHHGHVWVTDFGLAKTDGSDGLTHTGDIVGTLRYMAPERLDGWSDPRSDVYSLGVTLYELIALRPLFVATSRSSLIKCVTHDSPRSLSSFDANVPRDLDTIIQKAISKESSDRYGSAQDLASDLRLFLADQPIVARRQSVLERLRRWRRRNRPLAAVAGALVFVTVMGFAGVTWKWRDAEVAWQGEAKARAEANRRADELRLGRERLVAANQLIEKGLVYYHARRWDDAEGAFSNAIRLCPEVASATEKRGELYFQLGLFDLAAKDFQTAYQIQHPEETNKWLRLAALRLLVSDRAGYNDVCQTMWREAWGSTNHDDVIGLLKTGLLAGEIPRPQSLVPLAHKVSACQPEASTRYLLAWACLRANEPVTCVNYCRPAEASSSETPMEAIRWPILVIAYDKQGRTKEALEALLSATQAREGWIQQLFAGRGKHWRSLLGATGEWPIPPLDWLVFETLYLEAHCRLHDAPPPDDARLHVLRGRAFASLRRYSKVADAEYQAALRLRPDDAGIQLEALRNQAYWSIELGNYDQAAAAFAAAAERDAEDMGLWSAVAVTQLAADNVDGYAQTCQLMRERFGTRNDAASHHTMVWTFILHPASGMLKEDLLKAAESASKWWIDSGLVLVGAHYRAGEYDLALQSLGQSEEVVRCSPSSRFFQAMALQRLGRSDEARLALSYAKAAANDRTSAGWDELVAAMILCRETEAVIPGTLTGAISGH